MADRGGLPHVAAGQHGPFRNPAPRLENEVTGDDPVAHEARGFGVAAHRAVLQPGDPFQPGVRADPDIP